MDNAGSGFHPNGQVLLGCFDLLYFYVCGGFDTDAILANASPPTNDLVTFLLKCLLIFRAPMMILTARIIPG